MSVPVDDGSGEEGQDEKKSVKSVATFGPLVELDASLYLKRKIFHHNSFTWWLSCATRIVCLFNLIKKQNLMMLLFKKENSILQIV